MEGPAGRVRQGGRWQGGRISWKAGGFLFFCVWFRGVCGNGCEEGGLNEGVFFGFESVEGFLGAVVGVAEVVGVAKASAPVGEEFETVYYPTGLVGGVFGDGFEGEHDLIVFSLGREADEFFFVAAFCEEFFAEGFEGGEGVDALTEVEVGVGEEAGDFESGAVAATSVGGGDLEEVFAEEKVLLEADVGVGVELDEGADGGGVEGGVFVSGLGVAEDFVGDLCGNGIVDLCGRTLDEHVVEPCKAGFVVGLEAFEDFGEGGFVAKAEAGVEEAEAEVVVVEGGGLSCGALLALVDGGEEGFVDGGAKKGDDMDGNQRITGGELVCQKLEGEGGFFCFGCFVEAGAVDGGEVRLGICGERRRSEGEKADG